MKEYIVVPEKYHAFTVNGKSLADAYWNAFDHLTSYGVNCIFDIWVI